ncbi:MAG TPA: hypothetical protein VFO46_16470 [Candidatus Sulfotelmatobacter sp.]|nr:hypothetical protein [Candidatus Sulfotelmatobacter sp.]
MHGAWYILRWAWSAISIAYLLLYVLTTKRLGGQKKKRSEATFWVIVVLAVLRVLVRLVLGSGLVYRFAVVFIGIAAGIAALDLARMLITLEPGEQDAAVDVNHSKDRIQSLKLN